MDNVTHSLAGLLLAEVALQLRPSGAATRATRGIGATAAIASMVAANLPDSDLLYTGIGASHLDYMLQHRGYTHTVIGALLGATLLWGATLLIRHWRARSSLARKDVAWLLGLLVVSTMSHLVLDWTNSYGVHLFWPFDNRWQYGDAVFIVEPWFWVITIPMLVMATTNRAARIALSLLLIAGLVLAWNVSFVGRGAAIGLTLGAVMSVVLARALPSRPRIAIALAGWVAVTLVMLASSSVARAAVRQAVHAADPSTRLLDIAITPMPANAVCLTAITVEQSGATYRVEKARVSAVPSLRPASGCLTREAPGPMFTVSGRPSTARVQWDVEWSARGEDLASIARESCLALAALRFMRVPMWRASTASTVVLGDARFGDASGSGFADVRAPLSSTNCPRAVPPWIPPREDLISGRGQRVGMSRGQRAVGRGVEIGAKR
jgi:inner membrane protein